MSVSLCRCCQLELQFDPGVELRTCPACGTINARPQSEGPTLDVLQRAITQRLNCDFANAENSYQRVLLDFPEEHEALWGRLLCRYGVEYVEDPRSGRRLPVVHTVRRKPLQEEGDFRAACEFAPDQVRAQYEEEAAYIDAAMLRIRELSQGGPAYDVFLCHKTTTLEGDGFTKDYARAVDLYHLLTARGLQVFFAPKTLESVAGENYEAGIYHALCSARTMLVICSDPRHLISPWVMNEWQRFLEMADEVPGKRLIPLLYGDMSAAKLPREFRVRGLQAMLMSEMGAQEKLLDAIAPAAKQQAPASSAPAAPTAASAARHASIHKLLDVSLWDEAQTQVTACLEDNPADAQAHLYQLLIDLRLCSERDLASCSKDVESTDAWQRFVEHADADTYDRISGYLKAAKGKRTVASILGAIVAFIVPVLSTVITCTFGVNLFIPLLYTDSPLVAKLFSLMCPGLALFLIFFFTLRGRKTIVVGSCLAFSAISIPSPIFFSLLYESNLFPLLPNIFNRLLTIGLSILWLAVSSLFSALRVYRRLKKAE